MKYAASWILALLLVAIGGLPARAQFDGEDGLPAILRDCSNCYMQPDAFFAPPSPPPDTFDLPLAPPPDVFSIAEYNEARIAAAQQFSREMLCTAVLRRFFDPAGTCPPEASVKTANYVVSVIDGGEAFTVFLMQIAGKSERLANYRSGAFESHRYYFTYMLDLEGNMQLLLFGYEPLYNTGHSLEMVLNRNQPNTDYIPVTSDDKLTDLNNSIRDAIQGKLVTLVASAPGGLQ